MPIHIEKRAEYENLKKGILPRDIPEILNFDFIPMVLVKDQDAFYQELFTTTEKILMSADKRMSKYDETPRQALQKIVKARLKVQEESKTEEMPFHVWLGCQLGALVENLALLRVIALYWDQASDPGVVRYLNTLAKKVEKDETAMDITLHQYFDQHSGVNVPKRNPETYDLN